MFHVGFRFYHGVIYELRLIFTCMRYPLAVGAVDHAKLFVCGRIGSFTCPSPGPVSGIVSGHMAASCTEYNIKRSQKDAEGNESKGELPTNSEDMNSGDTGGGSGTAAPAQLVSESLSSETKALHRALTSRRSERSGVDKGVLEPVYERERKSEGSGDEASPLFKAGMMHDRMFEMHRNSR